MSIVNGYCTLAEIRARLQFVTADTADDTILESVVTGVSRWIDGYCGRHIYAATETRYYTAEFSDEVAVDDLLTVTSLGTDADGDRVYEDTWATTDYDLEPANATADGGPYTRIAIAPQGRYGFPVGARKGVKIAGSFGYASSTPAQIKEACLLQCERLYKRKDAPFGVIGSAEMGQMMVVPKLDPDVQILLAPFVRAQVRGV
jgi:hypothetical protein